MPSGQLARLLLLIVLLLLPLPLSSRASVTDHDSTKGLLIKNCQAFDGLGASVQLVDDRSADN